MAAECLPCFSAMGQGGSRPLLAAGVRSRYCSTRSIADPATRFLSAGSTRPQQCVLSRDRHLSSLCFRPVGPAPAARFPSLGATVSGAGAPNAAVAAAALRPNRSSPLGTPAVGGNTSLAIALKGPQSFAGRRRSRAVASPVCQAGALFSAFVAVADDASDEGQSADGSRGGTQASDGLGSSSAAPADPEKKERGLEALATAELKRILDLGGVSYRDCLEKGDLVRRLQGTRQFIPKAAQAELERALERLRSAPEGSLASASPDVDRKDEAGSTGYGAAAALEPSERGTKELLGAFSSDPGVPTPSNEAWWLDAERNCIRRFQQCGPSVVHIAALSPALRGASSLLDMNPSQIPRGTGSGFVWDREGHVVTNYHVVMNGSAMRVTLADASTWDANVVGVAVNKDLAVLKIDAPPSALSPLAIGSSEGLQVGQHVLAIGNPFGLDRTLTAGIISGVGRDIRSVGGRMIRGVVQTDASINPGNSGGPLLDSQGRLIGVNTAIYSPSGASAGVGFAIPVDTVKRTVERLISDGRAVRPALGVVCASDAQAAQLNLKGVLILSLQEGSPVQHSGLRATTRDPAGRVALGDVIIAVNGNKVAKVEDLFSIVEEFAPGQLVRVTVQRGATTTDLYVELTQMDD